VCCAARGAKTGPRWLLLGNDYVWHRRRGTRGGQRLLQSARRDRGGQSVVVTRGAGWAPEPLLDAVAAHRGRRRVLVR